MDHNHKLLQSIVENARMGADACDQLLNRTDDEELRREIMTQRDQYAAAARDAEKMITDMGAQPHPKGPMARMGMWMGMQMNTMMDKTASHIADMLIQGATMGIVEMTKARNSCPDANGDVQGIAARLTECQQGAIDRLKAFLQQQPVVQ